MNEETLKQIFAELIETTAEALSIGVNAAVPLGQATAALTRMQDALSLAANCDPNSLREKLLAPTRASLTARALKEAD